ncbi:MAG: Flp pilus assembly protein CpaB [Deltaproteobacteria bacterium]|nr:Flp pilus assembly protein CpaB [Deltaproteobacteria bacterium]
MQRPQSPGRSRAGLFLFGSLLLAVLAAGLVFRVAQRSQEQLNEAAKPSNTVDVVVAQRDLYTGLSIGDQDVVLRRVPLGSVPDQGIFSSLDDVVGRTPSERILAGEPIRDERLARPAQGIGLNAVVTPGKRAMTVATSTEDAAAGVLQPGNYVDIIVTIKPEDPAAANAKWANDTILQTIKVLAVGGSLSQSAADQTKTATSAPGEDGKKRTTSSAQPGSQQEMMRRMKPSITLEVTPEEAEKLALAVAQGDIHVVLRSDLDNFQYTDHGPITSRALIGSPAGPPSPIGRPKTDKPSSNTENADPSATVIMGSSRTDVKFNAAGTSTETTDAGNKNR